MKHRVTTLVTVISLDKCTRMDSTWRDLLRRRLWTIEQSTLDKFKGGSDKIKPLVYLVANRTGDITNLYIVGPVVEAKPVCFMDIRTRKCITSEQNALRDARLTLTESDRKDKEDNRTRFNTIISSMCEEHTRSFDKETYNELYEAYIAEVQRREQQKGFVQDGEDMWEVILFDAGDVDRNPLAYQELNGDKRLLLNGPERIVYFLESNCDSRFSDCLYLADVLQTRNVVSDPDLFGRLTAKLRQHDSMSNDGLELGSGDAVGAEEDDLNQEAAQFLSKLIDDIKADSLNLQARGRHITSTRAAYRGGAQALMASSDFRYLPTWYARLGQRIFVDLDHVYMLLTLSRPQSPMSVIKAIADSIVVGPGKNNELERQRLVSAGARDLQAADLLRAVVQPQRSQVEQGAEISTVQAATAAISRLRQPERLPPVARAYEHLEDLLSRPPSTLTAASGVVSRLPPFSLAGQGQARSLFGAGGVMSGLRDTFSKTRRGGVSTFSIGPGGYAASTQAPAAASIIGDGPEVSMDQEEVDALSMDIATAYKNAGMWKYITLADIKRSVGNLNRDVLPVPYAYWPLGTMGTQTSAMTAVGGPQSSVAFQVVKGCMRYVLFDKYKDFGKEASFISVRRSAQRGRASRSFEEEDEGHESDNELTGREREQSPHSRQGTGARSRHDDRGTCEKTVDMTGQMVLMRPWWSAFGLVIPASPSDAVARSLMESSAPTTSTVQIAVFEDVDERSRQLAVDGAAAGIDGYRARLARPYIACLTSKEVHLSFGQALQYSVPNRQQMTSLVFTAQLQHHIALRYVKDSVDDLRNPGLVVQMSVPPGASVSAERCVNQSVPLLSMCTSPWSGTQAPPPSAPFMTARMVPLSVNFANQIKAIRHVRKSQDVSWMTQRGSGPYMAHLAHATALAMFDDDVDKTVTYGSRFSWTRGSVKNKRSRTAVRDGRADIVVPKTEKGGGSVAVVILERDADERREDFLYMSEVLMPLLHSQAHADPSRSVDEHVSAGVMHVLPVQWWTGENEQGPWTQYFEEMHTLQDTPAYFEKRMQKDRASIEQSMPSDIAEDEKNTWFTSRIQSMYLNEIARDPDEDVDFKDDRREIQTPQSMLRRRSFVGRFWFRVPAQMVQLGCRQDLEEAVKVESILRKHVHEIVSYARGRQTYRLKDGQEGLGLCSSLFSDALMSSTALAVPASEFHNKTASAPTSEWSDGQKWYAQNLVFQAHLRGVITKEEAMQRMSLTEIEYDQLSRSQVSTRSVPIQCHGGNCTCRTSDGKCYSLTVACASAVLAHAKKIKRHVRDQRQRMGVEESGQVETEAVRQALGEPAIILMDKHDLSTDEVAAIVWDVPTLQQFAVKCLQLASRTAAWDMYPGGHGTGPVSVNSQAHTEKRASEVTEALDNFNKCSLSAALMQLKKIYPIRETGDEKTRVYATRIHNVPSIKDKEQEPCVFLLAAALTGGTGLDDENFSLAMDSAIIDENSTALRSSLHNTSDRRPSLRLWENAPIVLSACNSASWAPSSPTARYQLIMSTSVYMHPMLPVYYKVAAQGRPVSNDDLKELTNYDGGKIAPLLLNDADWDSSVNRSLTRFMQDMAARSGVANIVASSQSHKLRIVKIEKLKGVNSARLGTPNTGVEVDSARVQVGDGKFMESVTAAGESRLIQKQLMVVTQGAKGYVASPQVLRALSGMPSTLAGASRKRASLRTDDGGISRRPRSTLAQQNKDIDEIDDDDEGDTDDDGEDNAGVEVCTGRHMECGDEEDEMSVSSNTDVADGEELVELSGRARGSGKIHTSKSKGFALHPQMEILNVYFGQRAVVGQGDALEPHAEDSIALIAASIQAYGDMGKLTRKQITDRFGGELQGTEGKWGDFRLVSRMRAEYARVLATYYRMKSKVQADYDAGTLKPSDLEHFAVAESEVRRFGDVETEMVRSGIRITQPVSSGSKLHNAYIAPSEFSKKLDGQKQDYAHFVSLLLEDANRNLSNLQSHMDEEASGDESGRGEQSLSVSDRFVSTGFFGGTQRLATPTTRTAAVHGEHDTRAKLRERYSRMQRVLSSRERPTINNEEVQRWNSSSVRRAMREPKPGSYNMKLRQYIVQDYTSRELRTARGVHKWNTNLRSPVKAMQGRPPDDTCDRCRALPKQGKRVKAQQTTCEHSVYVSILVDAPIEQGRPLTLPLQEGQYNIKVWRGKELKNMEIDVDTDGSVKRAIAELVSRPLNKEESSLKSKVLDDFMVSEILTRRFDAAKASDSPHKNVIGRIVKLHIRLSRKEQVWNPSAYVLRMSTDVPPSEWMPIAKRRAGQNGSDDEQSQLYVLLTPGVSTLVVVSPDKFQEVYNDDIDDTDEHRDDRDRSRLQSYISALNPRLVSPYTDQYGNLKHNSSEMMTWAKTVWENVTCIPSTLARDVLEWLKNSAHDKKFKDKYQSVDDIDLDMDSDLPSHVDEAGPFSIMDINAVGSRFMSNLRSTLKELPPLLFNSVVGQLFRTDANAMWRKATEKFVPRATCISPRVKTNEYDGYALLLYATYYAAAMTGFDNDDITSPPLTATDEADLMQRLEKLEECGRKINTSFALPKPSLGMLKKACRFTMDWMAVQTAVVSSPHSQYLMRQNETVPKEGKQSGTYMYMLWSAVYSPVGVPTGGGAGIRVSFLARQCALVTQIPTESYSYKLIGDVKVPKSYDARLQAKLAALQKQRQATIAADKVVEKAKEYLQAGEGEGKEQQIAEVAQLGGRFMHERVAYQRIYKLFPEFKELDPKEVEARVRRMFQEQERAARWRARRVPLGVGAHRSISGGAVDDETMRRELSTWLHVRDVTSRTNILLSAKVRAITIRPTGQAEELRPVQDQEGHMQALGRAAEASAEVAGELAGAAHEAPFSTAPFSMAASSTAPFSTARARAQLARVMTDYNAYLNLRTEVRNLVDPAEYGAGSRGFEFHSSDIYHLPSHLKFAMEPAHKDKYVFYPTMSQVIVAPK